MRAVFVAVGWAISTISVLAAGVVLRDVWWGLLALAALGWLLAYAARRRRALGGLLLLGVALGGWRASMVPTTDALAPYAYGPALALEGVVVAAPDVRDTVVQLLVRVDGVRPPDARWQRLGAPATTLVRAPRDTPVAYGDRINVYGSLTRPGASDTFSYADYLAARQVYTLTQAYRVTVVVRDQGHPFMARLVALRARAADPVRRILPEPEASLLTGIAFGEERGIPEATRAAFADAGTAHLIAISGFNMVVVAGVVSALLSGVRLPGLVRGLLAAAAILVFAVFVGAGAAVLRAAVMSALVVAGRGLGRRAYLPATLAVAVVALSAWNPRVLLDWGFQLSVFAVLGLVLLADPFTRWMRAWAGRVPGVVGKALGWAAEPVGVTLAASLATLPLSALFFSRVSLVQLPANVLVAPVQAPLLLLGLAAGVLALIHPVLAIPPLVLVWPMLRWTVVVSALFAALPGAVQVWRPSPLTAYAVLGGLVLLGMVRGLRPQGPPWSGWLARREVRAAALTAMLGALAAGALVFAAQRPDGQLHVWFLDVGAGNAVLLQTPTGAQVLLDGGRYPSRLFAALGQAMPPFDRTLDLHVSTQPGEAFVGALPALRGRYTVTSYAHASAELAASVGITRWAAGDTIPLPGGVWLDVLHPPAEAPADDAPLVLRVRYGSVRLLLLGEVPAAQQRALAAIHDMRADVLQWPARHRRDAVQPALLEAIAPRLIVGAGQSANPRLPDVANGWEDALPGGRIVLGAGGRAVHVWTDGHTLQVQS